MRVSNPRQIGGSGLGVELLEHGERVLHRGDRRDPAAPVVQVTEEDGV